MVTAFQDEKSVVQLISDTLVITGRLTTSPEWYEFETVLNGISLGNIGGQLKSVFIKDMLEVLQNRNGKPLSSIHNAAYKEIVGGNDSEYLGYVALSSYNTFFFFKEAQQLIHVVFADNVGEMVAHTRFDIQIFHDWYRQLTQQK